MKNTYNTSAYGSFAYVYDIFMDIVPESLDILLQSFQAHQPRSFHIFLTTVASIPSPL